MAMFLVRMDLKFPADFPPFAVPESAILAALTGEGRGDD